MGTIRWNWSCVVCKPFFRLTALGQEGVTQTWPSCHTCCSCFFQTPHTLNLKVCSQLKVIWPPSQTHSVKAGSCDASADCLVRLFAVMCKVSVATFTLTRSDGRTTASDVANTNMQDTFGLLESQHCRDSVWWGRPRRGLRSGRHQGQNRKTFPPPFVMCCLPHCSVGHCRGQSLLPKLQNSNLLSMGVKPADFSSSLIKSLQISMTLLSNVLPLQTFPNVLFFRILARPHCINTLKTQLMRRGNTSKLLFIYIYVYMSFLLHIISNTSPTWSPRERVLLQPVSLKCYCSTGCSHGDDGGIIVPPEAHRLRPDAVTHPPPVAVD